MESLNHKRLLNEALIKCDKLKNRLLDTERVNQILDFDLELIIEALENAENAIDY